MGGVFSGVFGGGDKTAKRIAREQEKRERERIARINDGMSRIAEAFGGFDDNYFNQLRTAQLDWTLPQIQDQYEDAREQLTYALARAGQLDSTVAADRMAKLARDNQLALARADSMADQAVKSARSDIERERAELIAMLQATADPEAAANSARLRADALRIGQPMAEVGLLFQNATAGLAGAFQPRYDDMGRRVSGGPSFGGQRDQSRVVR